MADRLLWTPTREHARRFTGGHDPTRGPFGFFEYLGLDTVKFFDDFDYVTVPTGLYGSTAAGAGSATLAFNAQVNSAGRLTTGTVANTGISTLSKALSWQGQQNAVMEMRVKISAVTGAKIEVGFIDTLTGATPPDAGAVNVLATPSWNLTGDGVVWAFDTNDTTQWRGLGIAGGTATARVSPGMSPVAATYETVGIALLDGVAYFYHKATNGGVDYGPTALAAAVTKTVSLTPWAFVQTRNTTSKTLDIDYVACWQRRTVNN